MEMVNFKNVKDVFTKKLNEAAKELGYSFSGIKGISYNSREFSFKTTIITNQQAYQTSKVEDVNLSLHIFNPDLNFKDKVIIPFEDDSTKIYTIIGVTKRGKIQIENEKGKVYITKASNLKKVNDNSISKVKTEDFIDKEQRNQKIRELFKSGITIANIAKQFDLSYVRIASLVK